MPIPDLSNPLLWMLIGLVAGLIAFVTLRARFSPESMERRRRQRNHGRVISKVARPMVRLAVDAEAKPDRRQRSQDEPDRRSRSSRKR